MCRHISVKLFSKSFSLRYTLTERVSLPCRETLSRFQVLQTHSGSQTNGTNIHQQMCVGAREPEKRPWEDVKECPQDGRPNTSMSIEGSPESLWDQGFHEPVRLSCPRLRIVLFNDRRHFMTSTSYAVAVPATSRVENKLAKWRVEDGDVSVAVGGDMDYRDKSSLIWPFDVSNKWTMPTTNGGVWTELSPSRLKIHSPSPRLSNDHKVEVIDGVALNHRCRSQSHNLA